MFPIISTSPAVEISGYMMPALKYLVRISMGPNEETFKICVEHSSCTVGKKRTNILENGFFGPLMRMLWKRRIISKGKISGFS